MENAIRQGYENLATRLLKDFNNDWIGAIVQHSDESEFNKLRKFLQSDNYILFCDLCGINPDHWKKMLENLKVKASADNELYKMLKRRYYEQKHLVNEEDII